MTWIFGGGFTSQKYFSWELKCKCYVHKIVLVKWKYLPTPLYIHIPNNKMKYKKYHTIRAIPQSKIKIVERGKMDNPNPQIHDRSLFLAWYRHFNKKWWG